MQNALFQPVRRVVQDNGIACALCRSPSYQHIPAISALGIGLATFAESRANYLALALGALPALVANFHFASKSAVIIGAQCNIPFGVV